MLLPFRDSEIDFKITCRRFWPPNIKGIEIKHFVHLCQYPSNKVYFENISCFTSLFGGKNPHKITNLSFISIFPSPPDSSYPYHTSVTKGGITSLKSERTQGVKATHAGEQAGSISWECTDSKSVQTFGT